MKKRIQTDNTAFNAYCSRLISNNKLSIDNSILRLISIIIGGFSLYLGYALFIKGVTGQASISLNTSSISGQILNAAPGAFFALSGVVIIVIALYNKEEITITHPGKFFSENKYESNSNNSYNENEFDVPTFIRKNEN